MVKRSVELPPVGTTTVAGALLNIDTGVSLAHEARMNPQTRIGDDVLSRILFTRDSEEGLQQLAALIQEEMNDMLGELTKQAGISREQIYEISVAGNTTMQQLFCGLDPSALGEVPFVPVMQAAQHPRAADVGLCAHPDARAYVFPVIGGFVGGDTVAGLLASRLCTDRGAVLFVDIGTNGEIVLCHEGRLLAASTAAGPAFEGARIEYGMRASAGAIEKVLIDGDLRINVIGDVPPIGLCGSALIDATAELLRCGILMREGFLLDGQYLPEDLPPKLRARVAASDAGARIQLASAEESGTGSPVWLTQADIRELQLAVAAIRAGIDIMLQEAGVTATDLTQVLVAGGFGNFIRRSNAQRVGLLPHDVPRHKISFIGNAALSGARLAVMSRQGRIQADHYASQTEHIDLASSANFQMRFAEAMFFPEDEAT